MKLRYAFFPGLRAVSIAAMAVLVSIPAFAQSGRIVGNVTDKDGVSLPGANVVLVNTTLGAATDLDGHFTIVNVPVGNYDLQASMIGHEKVTKTGVSVSIDRTTNVDFTLAQEAIGLGDVVVVAEKDILHKEVSNSQQIIEGKQILEAAGVRTVNEYLGSQAGVTNERLLTIRGGSAEQTGVLVNGLSFVNARVGKAEATIPLSAIEQVSLQAGGFSAEYGNFRSGILNVATKTGSPGAYHGTFSYSRNNAHKKRFGQSLYDPDNFGLRPYMDPVVSFLGTDEGWLDVADSEEEASYLKQGHESFRGWDFFADRYNRGKEPEEQVTPMDLYLWSAWMHQSLPDFDALEQAHPEYFISDEQKQALRDHAHEPEGSNSDWDLDFGFGGPVPFVSRMLGNATFYLSNKTTNYNYVQPVMRDAEKSSTTLLTVQSNISQTLKLKLNSIYRKVNGTQNDLPTDGNVPDLDNAGDFMAINNLETFMAGFGSYNQYFWHPTLWQPKDQTTYVLGLSLNKVLSSSTFWDFSVSYAHQKDFFNPRETRDTTPLANFGPIWVDEMPYGITFGADTVFYDPGDPSRFFAHDNFEGVLGPVSLGGRRFASKVGQFHENSTVQQYRAKFDLSSQVNRFNFVKTGIELNYFNINNDNWRWWEGFDTIYELRDRRKPYQLGAYVQDQISLKGMEARVGVRVDYYNSGGGLWPTDAFNDAAFTRGTEADDIEQLRRDFENGVPVVWTRWGEINDELGGTFLEKTKNYLTVSPRIGISFPVTDRSKFFFNYGHFRSVTPYSQQFYYKMRFFKQGLFNLGNPNLEPPRTISYELGATYNLLDSYLVELSTYYKDVSGEAADIRYNNTAGTVTYDSYLNNRWEKDQGFELKITKNYGTYLTGWLNVWYVIDKNGNTGRETAYEDLIRNSQDDAFYAADENQPVIRPRIAANISLHSPRQWGVLGGFMLSVLPTYERGDVFTFNPASIRNLENNLRWPDYFMLNAKLSKSFNLPVGSTTFYVDVNNLLNRKVNWMSQLWAFREGAGGTDYNNYLASLHLPIYDSPEYDQIRELNAGKYIAGNDKVGDLRSAEKPYINDPDNPLFLYGQPRDIWFGVRFDF